MVLPVLLRTAALGHDYCLQSVEHLAIEVA